MKFIRNGNSKLFSIILTGIITSALWEIIKPFTKFIFITLSSLFILVSKNSINSTYKIIGNGFNELILIYLFTLILELMLSSCFVMIATPFFKNVFDKAIIKDTTLKINKSDNTDITFDDYKKYKLLAIDNRLKKLN